MSTDEGFKVKRARRWLLALALLSLLGTADSIYLLVSHPPQGTVGAGSATTAFCPAAGCAIVNQGEHSEFMGIPVAAYGVAGYLTLFGLSVLAAAFGGRGVLSAISALSGIGVGVSLYLTHLQVAVIGAICSWCMVSAVTMLSILAVSLISRRMMTPPGRRAPARQQAA
jgi:uncharacterized membrane protein